MKNSEVINNLLFNYGSLTEEQIIEECKSLPKKLIRWLGAYHPDNRTRKIFFRLTNIEIGDDTVINCNFIVSDDYKPLLKIGRRVAIAPNVTIICESNPNNSLLNNIEYVKEKLICDEPVVIKDDAWIGANCIILPGVTIGEKSIIGAGSVVNTNVPDSSIYAGAPAKLIKTL